jgi:hypothetical protein
LYATGHDPTPGKIELREEKANEGRLLFCLDLIDQRFDSLQGIRVQTQVLKVACAMPNALVEIGWSVHSRCLSLSATNDQKV